MSPAAVVPARIDLTRRWSIEGPLGQGGFGSVFAARDERGRSAALKLIGREPSLERESWSAPRVATIEGALGLVDVGMHGGHRVVVMPRARRSLAQAMGDESLVSRPGWIRYVLHSVARTLAALAALETPLVHRDVTPDNILEIDDRWHVADFGIAVDVSDRPAADPFIEAMTPEYTAPERWRGEPSTSAVDVYALGVVGFRLLARRLPFTGGGLGRQHVHAPVPPLDGTEPALEAIVGACLSKHPADRPDPHTLERWLGAA